VSERIYIPFLDGILDYNCRECGYFCCQSGDIIATPKEKNILLREFPALGFFYREEKNNKTTFKKFPRCWFLRTDGSCLIHRKFGYAAKPFICRLHPFYVARCAGEYAVIPFGCRTLKVTKRGQRSHVVHSAIIKNAREAAACGHIRGEMDWTPERLALERNILKESEGFLKCSDYAEFGAFQLSRSTGSRNIGEVRRRLAGSLGLWKRFLGIEDLSIESGSLTYELTALTPLLRATSPNLLEMRVEQIPFALLALYLYMVLYSRSGAARFADTYALVLGDLACGLARLNDEDLKMRGWPLEKRLRYVRILGQLYDHRPVKKGEKKRPPGSPRSRTLFPGRKP
jgi:Fe-S-cluster containining protein